MHAVETCFTASRDESEKLLEEHARNAYAEAKTDVDYDFRYRSPAEIGGEIQVQLIEMASETKHQHLSMHEILEISLRVYSNEELREQRRLQVSRRVVALFPWASGVASHRKHEISADCVGMTLLSLQALMHSLSDATVGVPGMVEYDSFLVAVKRLHSRISESQVSFIIVKTMPCAKPFRSSKSVEQAAHKAGWHRIWFA